MTNEAVEAEKKERELQKKKDDLRKAVQNYVEQLAEGARNLELAQSEEARVERSLYEIVANVREINNTARTIATRVNNDHRLFNDSSGSSDEQRRIVEKALTVRHIAERAFDDVATYAQKFRSGFNADALRAEYDEVVGSATRNAEDMVHLIEGAKDEQMLEDLERQLSDVTERDLASIEEWAESFQQDFENARAWIEEYSASTLRKLYEEFAQLKRLMEEAANKDGEVSPDERMVMESVDVSMRRTEYTQGLVRRVADDISSIGKRFKNLGTALKDIGAGFLKDIQGLIKVAGIVMDDWV